MKVEDWVVSNSAYGLCMPPMKAKDAKAILVEEVLDKDWAIAYPCNGEQEMAEIVYAVVAEVKRLRKPWWMKLFH